MLHKEILNENMLSLLIELQNKPQLSHFSLAGGTALALHLGHRDSTDIDLFTLKPILPNRLKKFLNNTYGNDIRYTMEDADSDFIHSFIRNIKVDFVCFKQKYIEEPKIIEGIKLFGIRDIGALKLEAIVNHRNKAKDFVDIYYLLKENSFDQMLEDYELKYGRKNTENIKKALLTYTKVDPSSWKNIKYSKETTVEDIQDTIKYHVNNHYNDIVYKF